MGIVSLLANAGQEHFEKDQHSIKDIDRNGYHCQGKSEGLKRDLSGFWSVRIDECNRIVFRIVEDKLEIRQCGNH